MKPFNNVAISSTEPQNGADVWIKHSKNKLNSKNFDTQNDRGISVTVNDDGTITLNGTVSSAGSLILKKNLNLELKGYNTLAIKKVSGEMSGQNFNLSMYNTNFVNAWSDTGRLFSIIINSNDDNFIDTQNLNNTAQYLTIYLNVATFNNYTFSLQLEEGTEATEYKQYVEDDILIKDKENYNSILKDAFPFKGIGLKNVNANNLKGIENNGIYAINVDSNNQNFPLNGGTLIVFFGNVSWGFQFFVPYDTNSNGAYIRNNFGDQWSSWKQL